jgi:polar amino acid transport system ATP-binding protein
VFDQPFSRLDIGNIQSIKRAIRIIKESHELNTVIFNTHDIELAVELADSHYVAGHPKLEKGGQASYGTLLKHCDLGS